MIFRFFFFFFFFFLLFHFYRLSDLGFPDFMDTTGLGCCIPTFFMVRRIPIWPVLNSRLEKNVSFKKFQ